jgi:hypothetical protein
MSNFIIKAQILSCPKCKSILDSKQEPFCFTDKIWLQKVKEATAKGLILSTIKERPIHSKCNCDDAVKLSKLQLKIDLI